jgi:ATP-binding cassette subfamily C protein
MTAIRLLRNIFGLLDKRERTMFIGLVVMMFLAGGLEIIGIGIVTAFIGIIINPHLIAEHRALNMVYDLLGATSVRQFAIYTAVALFVIFLFKNAYLALLVFLQTTFALNKEATLSKQLLSAYLAKPYTFHLQRNSADLLKNITVEVSHVITGILVPSMVLLTEAIVLIFILFLLAAIEPVVAIAVFLILGAASSLFIRQVRPLLTRSGQLRSISAGSRIKWVNQALGSIKQIKLSGKEAFFTGAFFESSIAYSRAGIVATTLQHLPRLIVETLAVTSILVVVIVIQGQGRDLQSLLPVVTLFALAAMRVMPSVNRITPAYNQLRYWFPAVEAIYRDLQFARDQGVQRSLPKRPETTESMWAGFSSDLALCNLWFRYPDSQEWAIRDVSIRIEKGTSIAFMGSSGAGKSTLIELILGLITPDKGVIQIDGHQLNDVRATWQKDIGYVPQAIYLMDDTIRRNVAFGIEDDQIDDAKVLTALRVARLEEMAAALPDKLDTLVGERGVRLSGGERQRLGIARAMYYDPEVLVLDEATSALDGETERAIAEMLSQLMHAKTILIIAHRVTTIKNCDSIFFIKRGEVADIGNYNQLMERNEDFRNMVGDSSEKGTAE